jgi:hypothetical protein
MEGVSTGVACEIGSESFLMREVGPSVTNCGGGSGFVGDEDGEVSGGEGYARLISKISTTSRVLLYPEPPPKKILFFDDASQRRG